MKTDRELLGLAAKAADIERGADRIESGVSSTESDGRHRSLPQWNPLEDDGDALRLAVTLGLGISIPLKAERTDVITFDGPVVSVIEKHGDPGVATRRAIVRAAAEIGGRQ